MISPAEASFTRIDEISASCWANCVVKLAGMCWTNNTAPGNSLGNAGTSFISVAGPPVEAAMTTMGNFPSPRFMADESENMDGAADLGAAVGLLNAPKLLFFA